MTNIELDMVKSLDAKIAQLEQEKKKLQEQLCLVRGAIDELAYGIREPHWKDHFLVFNRADFSQYAVPWEWIEPPFQLVQDKMNSMGDYGTRTVEQAQAVDWLRPDSERYQWLVRQSQFNVVKNEVPEGVFLSWTRKFVTKYGEKVTTETVEAATLNEAIDKVRKL